MMKDLSVIGVSLPLREIFALYRLPLLSPTKTHPIRWFTVRILPYFD